MKRLDDWDIISGIGITALGVAAARAVESERDDALIRDPYAAAFVTRAETSVPMPTSPADLGGLAWSGASNLADPDADDAEVWNGLWSMMTGYMGVRSKYFDDFLSAATSAGIRQVVILAAGLDTRAHRLAWPSGVTLFEIDQPRVLGFKDTVLGEQGATPGVDRRSVPVDLRADWPAALTSTGFDAARPTAWLAEGLLPYLPTDAGERLFGYVDRLSAPGSRLAAEHVDTAVQQLFDEPAFQRAQEEFGVDMASLWPDGERPDPVAWFRGNGWQVATVTGEDAAERFGRSFTGTVTVGFGQGTALLTARRD